MVPARRLLAPVLAAALGLGPLGASAQTPPGLRQDLDAVAAALDRAVREVSRPGAFSYAGPSTRAYALPGVGAVFVLSPRALPVRPARAAADRQAARALADAMAHLQESLRRVRAPELREQIEQSLEAVRQAQAELRATRPGTGGSAPVVLGLPPPEDLAGERQEELAHRARALREAQRAGRDATRELREQWEAQVRALGAQTDAFAREAERMRAEAERALRDQLRVAWPELAEPPLPPDPPAAPEAAVPPDPPAAPEAAVAPAAPAAPAAPPAPAFPPPPPWSPWLEIDDGADAPDADTVIATVRAAVLGVLDAHAARLARLAPEESAVVAVDFVPRHPRAGAPRTVVWRVRNKDLDDRARGRLSPEEFRRRVQISEY